MVYTPNCFYNTVLETKYLCAVFQHRSQTHRPLAGLQFTVHREVLVKVFLSGSDGG
jgi:hypothetical protein